MTIQDAKFILCAHRTDGRYLPDDPLFKEALAEAASNPELAAWLAREHAVDTAIAGRLEEIQPPAGLREAILIGSRASRVSRRWWQNPAWFLAAASVMILLAISSVLMRSTAPVPPAASLAEFGLDQLAFGRHTHNRSPGAAELEQRLTASAEPLRASLNFDAAELGRRGCEEFSFGSRRVYEICFQRNGTWYHLYVTTRDSDNPHDAGPEPSIIQRHGLAAATWSHGDTLFALATTAGVEALQRAL